MSEERPVALGLTISEWVLVILEIEKQLSSDTELKECTIPEMVEAINNMGEYG